MIKRVVNFFKERKKLKIELEEEQRRIKEESERKRLALNSVLNNFFSDDLIALSEKTSSLSKDSLISIVEQSIDNALSDNFLSLDEEKRISDFMDFYNISNDEISGKSLIKITQAALLRDLFEGNINPRVNFPQLPFNLLKKEILIWVFSPVNISEIKTVKEWKGGNKGVSFKVVKGVYFRVGGTKGRFIENQEYKNLGQGIVAVTNYCVYFKVDNIDAMRIKYEKIISVEADAQNVIIFRDGARSNPICFTTEDAWFLANAIQNATNWQ